MYICQFFNFSYNNIYIYICIFFFVRRLNDSLDIILKLIILYKEKCINIEKDIMKILQVFTVHSKNKTVTIYCLKIFANIQSFYPNFYKYCIHFHINIYQRLICTSVMRMYSFIIYT